MSVTEHYCITKSDLIDAGVKPWAARRILREIPALDAGGDGRGRSAKLYAFADIIARLRAEKRPDPEIEQNLIQKLREMELTNDE